jgi:hypothetical protein
MQVVAKKSSQDKSLSFRSFMLTALVALCPFPSPATPVLDAVVVQLHSTSFNLVAIAAQVLHF